MKCHKAQAGGFTPTPILVLFRFLKILSLVAVTSVQELISAKNISETKKPHQNWCRGFTLVEVLVSLGIFALLTGVVLAKYRTFDTNAKFANASEDIVLALRQAQVYGVGVKGAGSSFAIPYGVYFDTATPNKMLIFADTYPAAAPPLISGDCKYTALQDTLVEMISWGNVVPSLSVKCGGVACGNNKLNITFKRPNPDAIICDGVGASYSNAQVIISNGVTGAGARFSTTTITNAGQISL